MESGLIRVQCYSIQLSNILTFYHMDNFYGNKDLKLCSYKLYKLVELCRIKIKTFTKIIKVRRYSMEIITRY
jgi:hypothetical protein